MACYVGMMHRMLPVSFIVSGAGRGLVVLGRVGSVGILVIVVGSIGGFPCFLTYLRFQTPSLNSLIGLHPPV